MKNIHNQNVAELAHYITVFYTQGRIKLATSQPAKMYPALESISHFLPQSVISCRSDSISEAILVAATDQMPDHT